MYIHPLPTRTIPFYPYRYPKYILSYLSNDMSTNSNYSKFTSVNTHNRNATMFILVRYSTNKSLLYLL